jgi:hypothetical protein
MGTQELVAQSRQQRAAKLMQTAAEMHAISFSLHDPKLREANEEHAHRLEEMARQIDTNAVLQHAKGRA